jgi:hypothetical protein
VEAQWFNWGGGFRRAPEDFEFPKVNILFSWQFWCCGDLKRNIVPFRNFESRDMSKQNSRKRLSDFKFLMNILEDEAKKKHLWKASINISDANSIFYQVSQVLDIQAASKMNRKRRLPQMQWRTLVKELRISQKKRRT